MKKKTTNSILAIVMCLTSSLSFARDVKPNKMSHGSLYVRVTKINKTHVKFEKCNFGYEVSSCQTLGRKKSYAIKELESQRTIENLQIAGAVAADIGVVLAGFIIGVHGLPLLQAFIPVEAGAVGALAGSVAGGVVATAVDAINPIEQTRQAKVLNSNVINDEAVSVEKIEQFIERLDLLLSKID